MEQDEKQKTTMELPTEVIESIRILAKKHRRSFVGEIVWALEQYIAREEGATPAGQLRQEASQ